MVKTEAFPTIRMKIDRLLKITNEYQFNDLVKAVYCINLCINNRSVLESCLALNACLIEYEEKGSKRIGTYDEFKGFFGKIYDVMKPGIADDYTVEDFGEVQLRYNDKFYRVIIGTGHNNVYACLNFLPTLARNISREEELCLALEYVSGTIDYFIEENKNDGVVEKRFVLPTEILFYKVQKFFKEEVKKYDILELDSLMMSEGTTIEKSHFVCREDNIYPLYNVSLLIDLYDIWENKIDFKEQISVANEGIIDRIYSLFEMDRSRSCSIFAPAMIFPEQKYDSSQRTYTFIASINGDIIFSPITMDRLKKDWLNGIMDFILPYEVRMNKTKQLIVEWKKSYEKQIVYDIANSFKKNKFDIIKQNFELMKLNKSHPQWLGDYDVFAVDINNKSIWIVECKVIEKVATFYDMYRQQNRFFNEHKEDEKFQRRIDYLRENADQVIQQLGCTDYIGYKVIPYMCMNKVLVSRYKKVTFPIVSYPELVEIISGATRE